MFTLAPGTRIRISPYSSWWVLTGSNRRHSPCKSDALPAELSTRSLAENPLAKGALVYRVLEGLASTELGQASGGDLHFGAGARVAAQASGALAGVEGAEADQGDLLVLAQARLHATDQRVDRALGRGLGDLRGLRDLVHEVGLVHALNDGAYRP